MTFSINNRIVLEQYIKEGLKAVRTGGIATPGQRDGVKGLKVLIGTTLPNGERIPVGSIAYIREEVLHTHQWASKPLTCDTLPCKFLVVELTYIEFIETPEPKDVA